MPLVSLDDATWFGVQALPERHAPIRRHFPDGWHVYYLNSHEGCGCGFHSDERFPDDDAEYDRESRRRLAEYLRQALRDSPIALALYDCWEGAELEPVRQRSEATPEDIESRLDPVPEGTLVLIRARAA
jgi:hypothetical protein